MEKGQINFVIKKIGTFISKNWKRDIVFFISGLFLSPLISPYVIDLVTPQKDITIYHSSTQNIGDIDVVKLLANLSNVKGVHAIVGCNKGMIWIGYNYRIDGIYKPISFEGVNPVPLNNCSECTAYLTVIRNDNHKTMKDISIDVSLFDNNYILEEYSSLTIENEANIKGKSGFKIVVDELGPGEMAILSWSTKLFNNISFDCTISEKQRCTIIKEDIAIPSTYNAVHNTLFPMLKMTEEDVHSLPLGDNKYNEFILDMETRKFISDDHTSGYLGRELPSDCDHQNPSPNPISNLQFP